MPSSFQLRTYPEILTKMKATNKATYDADIDLNVGSLDLTQLEASALQAAAIYVQVGKLVDLFARGNCKGDDLDQRAEDFGSLVFKEMRRRPAQSSITQILVGDGSTTKKAMLVSDSVQNATTLFGDDLTGWPSAGSLVVERGTLREESAIYTRVGNTVTVISPSGGLINPHLQSGLIETVSTKSKLSSAVLAGSSSAAIQPGTEGAWPASGNIIFERDTVRRELRSYTRVGSTLTLGAVTTFGHALGTDVTLSTFGSDRQINSGSVCIVPASLSSKVILWRTTQLGTLLDGDFTSGLIPVESDDVGEQTKVGSGTITQWQNEPFANATVTNPNAATRGRDRESDDDYNARISAFIQSLSRATALSIETLVAGQQDPFTEKTIAFAQTVEPVAPGEAQLYVTDGTTTFTIDSEIKTGRDVLIADARQGDKRARLNAYGPFSKIIAPSAQITPRIFKSVVNGSGSATLVGSGFLEDSTKVWTVGQFSGKFLKTDDNQFYPIVGNTAIRVTVNAAASGSLSPSFGSYAIFDFAITPLVPDTDYTFNQSNGNLELVTGLNIHEALVAADDNALGSVGAYTYSRGLAAYAQRLVNGDKTDLDNFPGIKALGTSCRVVAPTVTTPTIVIQIVTQSGLADADLAATVQSIIQSYVNGLGIGQTVLLSEIIRLVKALPGVADCKILQPTANFPVMDGQIARMNASDVVVV